MKERRSVFPTGSMTVSDRPWCRFKIFSQRFSGFNGISGDEKQKTANGMNCLVAQLIAHFKKEAGYFYLYPAGTRDCGEEYIYTVSLAKPEQKPEVEFPANLGHLHLKVQAGAMAFFGLPETKQNNIPVIFDGLVELFDP